MRPEDGWITPQSKRLGKRARFNDHTDRAKVAVIMEKVFSQSDTPRPALKGSRIKLTPSSSYDPKRHLHLPRAVLRKPMDDDMIDELTVKKLKEANKEAIDNRQKSDIDQVQNAPISIINRSGLEATLSSAKQEMLGGDSAADKFAGFKMPLPIEPSHVAVDAKSSQDAQSSVLDRLEPNKAMQANTGFKGFDTSSKPAEVPNFGFGGAATGKSTATAAVSPAVPSTTAPTFGNSLNFIPAVPSPLSGISEKPAAAPAKADTPLSFGFGAAPALAKTDAASVPAFNFTHAPKATDAPPAFSFGLPVPTSLPANGNAASPTAASTAEKPESTKSTNPPLTDTKSPFAFGSLNNSSTPASVPPVSQPAAPAAAPTFKFGSSAPAQTPVMSSFGQAQPTAAATPAATGAAPPLSFGAPISIASNLTAEAAKATSSLFGAPAETTHSTTNAPAFSFGTNSATSTPSIGPPKANAMSAFGAPATAAPTFGTPFSSAPSFGAPATVPSFGTSANTAPAFGITTGSNSTGNSFGAAVTNSTPSFGASSLATAAPAFSFGSAPSSQPAFSFGNASSGTNSAPGSSMDLGQSSQTTPAAAATSFSFGAQPAGFGSANAATPAVNNNTFAQGGQQSHGGFSGGFGQSSSGFPSVGAPASTSFGQSGQANTGFGASGSNTPFGQPASTPPSFGAPNASPAFGQPAAFQFSAQPPAPNTFSFGQQAAPAAAGQGFSFGAAAAAPAFTGAAPSTAQMQRKLAQPKGRLLRKTTRGR